MMAKVIIPNTADWFKNARLKDGLYQFSDGMTLFKLDMWIAIVKQ